MEIRVADAGRPHADQHLAGAHLGNRDFADLERRAEGSDDSGFHGLREHGTSIRSAPFSSRGMEVP